MGLAESGLKTIVTPCSHCMIHVLGNIECSLECCCCDFSCETKDDKVDEEELLYCRRAKSCTF